MYITLILIIVFILNKTRRMNKNFPVKTYNSIKQDKTRRIKENKDKKVV